MKRLTLLALLLLCTIFTFGQSKIWINPSLEKQNIIHGRGFNDSIATYGRLPFAAEKIVRKPLWALSQNSAGLSIKFITNSPTITVRYAVTSNYAMEHMPATGVSGVDMYRTDANGKVDWMKGFYKFEKDTLTYIYSDIAAAPHNFGNEFQLFLPLYNTVKWLEIGIDSSSTFEFIPVSSELPIVIYGTSITQGACASRPGMAWATILGRQTQNPIVNLGFSGNGQLEMEMFEYLSQLPSKLYIIDCMPNMTNNQTALIYDRVIAGVNYLRSKSNAPILLVEHGGYMNDGVSKSVRNSYVNTNIELKRAYESLINNGVKGLNYMTKEEMGVSQDAQVDGIHPTDLGMRQTADGYTEIVSKILNQPSGELQTQKAVKQNRDAESYNWNKRHENILTFNKGVQPEILMIGNSITHFFGEKITPTRASGVNVWNDIFKGKTVANMGYGWDKIENVLWRVYHGELDGFQAKKIFLMIGTNNLPFNSENEIIDGLDFLVKQIQIRQPSAQIYVMTIVPRQNMNEKRVAVNNKIVTHDWPRNVFAVPYGEKMMGNDDKINETLFTDGVHPNENGYKVLAETIKPLLK